MSKTNPKRYQSKHSTVCNGKFLHLDISQIRLNCFIRRGTPFRRSILMLLFCATEYGSRVRRIAEAITIDTISAFSTEFGTALSSDACDSSSRTLRSPPHEEMLFSFVSLRTWILSWHACTSRDVLMSLNARVLVTCSTRFAARLTVRRSVTRNLSPPLSSRNEHVCADSPENGLPMPKSSFEIF